MRRKVEKLNFLLSGVILPLLLLFSAIVFLFVLRGVPFRHPRRFLRGLRSSGARNAVSPSKALMLALAGTLGVGNIVGVADALRRGGPGVLFWMWVSSFAAMTVKYAEVLLASATRRSVGKELRGGAMYYITPRALASVFCLFGILCGFSVGGSVQSLAFGEAAQSAFGGKMPLYTVIFAAVALFCIFFSRGRASAIASAAVPVMTFLYVALTLSVILRRASALPSVFASIFDSAFSFKAAAGGCVGGGLVALRFGVIRGLLSNEAGCGTAPIAHARSSSQSAAAQAWLGVPEVAIDTLLLCSLTGLALLCRPDALLAPTPMGAVTTALSDVFGRCAAPLLAVSIFAFALATVLCWSVYLEAFSFFLLPDRRFTASLLLLFCLALAAAPIFPEKTVWDLSDLSVCLMTLVNLVFLIRHRRFIEKETRRFLLSSESAPKKRRQPKKRL